MKQAAKDLGFQSYRHQGQERFEPESFEQRAAPASKRTMARKPTKPVRSLKLYPLASSCSFLTELCFSLKWKHDTNILLLCFGYICLYQRYGCIDWYVTFQ